MSVSRDFIDSYSPEVPEPWDCLEYEPALPLGGVIRAIAQCGSTPLVFGFHGT